MARPRKRKADYFPHECKHGKTLFIIEKKYGNDGYAFYFKLLELLAGSEDHYYDCRSPEHWEFFLAKTSSTAEMAESILSTLVSVTKIDKWLWSKRVIWYQSLVDRLSFMWGKRTSETPPTRGFCIQKLGLRSENEVSDIGSTQRKVKESKVKKSKPLVRGRARAEFVTMTDEEFQKLVNQFGEKAVARMIKILDDYKGSTGKKYASDYRAILSWVVKRYEQDGGAVCAVDRDKAFLQGGAADV